MLLVKRTFAVPYNEVDEKFHYAAVTNWLRMKRIIHDFSLILPAINNVSIFKSVHAALYSEHKTNYIVLGEG